MTLLPHHLIPGPSRIRRSRRAARAPAVVAVGKAAPFMADTFAGSRAIGFATASSSARICRSLASGARMDSIESSAARRAERGRRTPRARVGAPHRLGGDARRAALGWCFGPDGGPAGDTDARRQACRGERVAEGRLPTSPRSTRFANICLRSKEAALLQPPPGPTVCLAISDVVGDDLSVIGSGPTVPDPSTFRDAWDYVERFGVEGAAHSSGDELSARRLEGHDRRDTETR